MESMSWPLTPKSHSLISPRELTRMLEGFTSTMTGGFGWEERGKIRLCNISCLDLNRGNHKKNTATAPACAISSHLRRPLDWSG